MNLGEYLRLILIKKNITQVSLRDRLNEQEFSLRGGNYDVADINNMISGKRNISLVDARRIEMALDLPLHSFVDLAVRDNSVRKNEQLKDLEKLENYYKEKYGRV